MDNREAKELRMVVVLQGGDRVWSPGACQVLERLVHQTAREIGADSVAITFPSNPQWNETDHVHETETDWLVE